MSTADNATITLAAQIGQHRPQLRPASIATVAGKLVKVCSTIRKRNNDATAAPFFTKADVLAKEVGGTFNTHIPYGEEESGIEFYINFGVDPVFAVRIDI